MIGLESEGEAVLQIVQQLGVAVSHDLLPAGDVKLGMLQRDSSAAGIGGPAGVVWTRGSHTFVEVHKM